MGARLYMLNTTAKNQRDHADAPDIRCPMCGKCTNPNLHHILSECMHGGPARMLDIHNRVACAVRKAIELGNPEATIVDDKTVLSFCSDLATEFRRKRPDLTFESARKDGHGHVQNIYLAVL
jgi:hypothetical protein